MPKGIPVATVAIDNSHNAALLAIRMLGINDVKIIGVGKDQYSASLGGMISGRILPWVQDSLSNGYPAWTEFDASQREVFILDYEGNIETSFDITPYNPLESEDVSSLTNLILSYRESEDDCNTDEVELWGECYNIESTTFKNRVGIWVIKNQGKTLDKEKKIGAIGLRIKKWITYHGLSFNIKTNLEYYDYINSCGLLEYKNTSLENLGIDVSVRDFDKEYLAEFKKNLKNL